MFYCFLVLEYIAKPIVPNDSPATDAPHEKKFKKNVDSNIWMTIRKVAGLYPGTSGSS